ncbi:MAG: hypothetical protein C0600_16110 [Ignavibacteria bacterium]|nr:MAG: hypothetical protein C0600_16110 [Ignavibacteria bacterium]
MECLLSAEGGLERHYSPIRIEELVPQKTGQGEFELAFYHAGYPAGVRDKRYRLRTLNRSTCYLVAQRLDDPAPHMTIIFHDLSREWLKEHFCINVEEDETIDDILERIAQSPW